MELNVKPFLLKQIYKIYDDFVSTLDVAYQRFFRESY